MVFKLPSPDAHLRYTLGMPELSRFFGIIIRMYMEAGEPQTTLNELMASNPDYLGALRRRCSELLAFGSAIVNRNDFCPRDRSVSIQRLGPKYLEFSHYRLKPR